ncbi:family 43 glycosylhydrolase [Terriglobus aquaticus]|uniref:Family 43 glycosylhydrolase n=1 Tax=Terriglobus aquaticus TaxID=940139 RepID=A0ABW9KIN3_9BACT
MAQRVVPGAVWRDTSGKVIQAHGGGVTPEGAYWYWFGEDRSQDLPKERRAVHVYRSRDLMTWEDRGRALEMGEPAEYVAQYGTDWQLERPKVFVAAPGSKHRYVMYVHLDAAYKAAEVGVAVADRMEGPYTLVKHFRPLGEESRDIGQFVDDDGTNYLIFEARPTKGFFIAKLSADALEVVEKTAFVPAPLEGGAVVRTGGLYFCIGSHMTGWKPNPDVYATAKSLAGPWSTFQNLAPPEMNTYGGQSAELLKVAGRDGRPDAVIFIGDIWKPQALWDSRYLWMPLQVRNGAMMLPKPEPWSIDVNTGAVKIFHTAEGVTE